MLGFHHMWLRKLRKRRNRLQGQSGLSTSCIDLMILILFMQLSHGYLSSNCQFSISHFWASFFCFGVSSFFLSMWCPFCMSSFEFNCWFLINAFEFQFLFWALNLVLSLLVWSLIFKVWIVCAKNNSLNHCCNK